MKRQIRLNTCRVGSGEGLGQQGLLTEEVGVAGAFLGKPHWWFGELPAHRLLGIVGAARAEACRMRSLSEKGETRVGLAGQALAPQGLGHHLAREAPPPAEAPEAQVGLGWGLLS
ncbi:unnamed protein product [Rangifer tarandus platyrhynchus]|uniref:Uncharacterized protein n=1 Tax=Rangifer tarandus platyrhynchus TaxID=3082113 RepID=A0ABN8XSN5_RANTA|nr:unnamed protein product [Rangifer tarandus platyrhynchus]